MSPSKDSRVFILGAGCSADYEYPLGNSLASELVDFKSTIPGNCSIIRQCVENTIAVAEGHLESQNAGRFDTLDQIAKYIEESWKPEGSNRSDEATSALRSERIADAKIATAAMFLAREEKALETGLNSYMRFMDSIFGGGSWNQAVAAANCHVLTFNYDRLFEIAFLEYFRKIESDTTMADLRGNLYSCKVLNSGFNHGDDSRFDDVKISIDGFCLLKLHGSAGWWAKKDRDYLGAKPCPCHYWPYWPEMPANQLNLQAIEGSLKKNGIYVREAMSRQDGAIVPLEALIVFPHEKQRSMLNCSNCAYDPYIRQVWEHAAQLLAAATEVEVIGYSFSAIDSRHMVNELLLRATHAGRIVVRNPEVATVQAKLQSYAQLRGRVKFLPSRFGEGS